MPQVSVLLPCYNAAATLTEALDSILQQGFQDFEIVAVNDGSQDETQAILEAYASRYSNLHMLSQPHLGIIAALNSGLQVCRGEFIARMDADDRSHPERLARQVAFLQENPDVAVVGCLVSAFPREQVRQGFQIYLEWLNGLVSNAEIQREIFIESPLPHPSVMFRRAAVLDAGGYQEHGWPEDYDLWLRLSLAGATFGKVSQTLFEWRESPGRLTRTDSRYSLENFLRAKAHYLAQGPLTGRDAVIIWGAGMIGRRISKHLLRGGAPLVAFVDIDPKKIGRTRRDRPIIAPQDLPGLWNRHQRPVVLAAVGARGARKIIRERLNGMGFIEAQDWWGVA